MNGNAERQAEGGSNGSRPRVPGGGRQAGVPGGAERSRFRQNGGRLFSTYTQTAGNGRTPPERQVIPP